MHACYMMPYTTKRLDAPIWDTETDRSSKSEQPRVSTRPDDQIKKALSNSKTMNSRTHVDMHIVQMLHDTQYVHMLTDLNLGYKY